MTLLLLYGLLALNRWWIRGGNLPNFCLKEKLNAVVPSGLNDSFIFQLLTNLTVLDIVINAELVVHVFGWKRK